jgi:hypothetical protein
MPTPVTPAVLRERARRAWERDGRRWAVGEVGSARIELPLHPPTERDALADLGAAIAWVDAWRRAEAAGGIDVDWERRRWARVGDQDVPVRVRIESAPAIAALAGAGCQWRRWHERAAELVAELGPVLAEAGHLPDAIARHLRMSGELDAADFDRLRHAAEWLAVHPASGRFLRELPIRGIDTKWLERHHVAVTALIGRGDLGLRQPPQLARVRFLDPALTPSGLDDVTAPLSALDSLGVAPAHIIIVENLQTLLALPARPGTVAIDGAGDRVPRLAQLSWVLRAECVYWGDLDSHGFRILALARGAGLRLRSCLMDTDTLLAFRDLWVPEPQPFRGDPGALTPDESAALRALRECGDVRLEQERIDWSVALAALDQALQ